MRLPKTYFDFTFSAIFCLFKMLSIRNISWWWVLAVVAFDVIRSVYSEAYRRQHREQ